MPPVIGLGCRTLNTGPSRLAAVTSVHSRGVKNFNLRFQISNLRISGSQDLRFQIRRIRTERITYLAVTRLASRSIDVVTDGENNVPIIFAMVTMSTTSVCSTDIRACR